MGAQTKERWEEKVRLFWLNLMPSGWVLDFIIEVVVWPDHIGHKDGSAAVGIMRETCRELEC